MGTNTLHQYITRDKSIARGKPVIKGTRTRVANLVAYHKLGYTPEELAREFPHLSLAQIYNALSFYYENAAEIDKDIDDEREDNLMMNIK